MSARNSLDDKKQEIDHLEDVVATEAPAQDATRPESLRALSDEEYKKMERKIVFKADIVVMYVQVRHL